MDFSKPWGYNLSRPSTSSPLDAEWVDHHGHVHRSLRPLQAAALRDQQERQAAKEETNREKSAIAGTTTAMGVEDGAARLSRKVHRQFGSFLLAKSLAERNAAAEKVQSNPIDEISVPQVVLDESESPPFLPRTVSVASVPSISSAISSRAGSPSAPRSRQLHYRSNGATTLKESPKVTPKGSPKVSRPASPSSMSTSIAATTSNIVSARSSLNSNSNFIPQSPSLISSSIPQPVYVRPLTRDQVRSLRSRIDLLPPAIVPHPLSKEANDPSTPLVISPPLSPPPTVNTIVVNEDGSVTTAPVVSDDLAFVPSNAQSPPLLPHKLSKQTATKTQQLQSELFAMVSPLQHASMSLTPETMSQMKKIARSLKESNSTTATAYPPTLRALAQHRMAPWHQPLVHTNFDQATQPLLELLAPHVRQSKEQAEKELLDETRTRRYQRSDKQWRAAPGFDPTKTSVARELNEANRAMAVLETQVILPTVHTAIPPSSHPPTTNSTNQPPTHSYSVHSTDPTQAASVSLGMFRSPHPSNYDPRPPISVYRQPYQSVSTALGRGGVEREGTQLREVRPDEIERVEPSTNKLIVCPRDRSPDRAAPLVMNKTLQTQLKRPHEHTQFLVDQITPGALYRAGLIEADEVLPDRVLPPPVKPTSPTTHLDSSSHELAHGTTLLPTRHGRHFLSRSRSRSRSRSQSPRKFATFLNRSRVRSRQVSPSRLNRIDVVDHFPTKPSQHRTDIGSHNQTVPAVSNGLSNRLPQHQGFLSTLLHEIYAMQSEDAKEQENSLNSDSADPTDDWPPDADMKEEVCAQENILDSNPDDSPKLIADVPSATLLEDNTSITDLSSNLPSVADAASTNGVDILTLDHGMRGMQPVTIVRRQASFEFEIGGGSTTENMELDIKALMKDAAANDAEEKENVSANPIDSSDSVDVPSQIPSEGDAAMNRSNEISLHSNDDDQHHPQSEHGTDINDAPSQADPPLSTDSPKGQTIRFSLFPTQNQQASIENESKVSDDPALALHPYSGPTFLQHTLITSTRPTVSRSSSIVVIDGPQFVSKLSTPHASSSRSSTIGGDGHSTHHRKLSEARLHRSAEHDWIERAEAAANVKIKLRRSTKSQSVDSSNNSDPASPTLVSTPSPTHRPSNSLFITSSSSGSSVSAVESRNLSIPSIQPLASRRASHAANVQAAFMAQNQSNPTHVDHSIVLTQRSHTHSILTSETNSKLLTLLAPTAVAHAPSYPSGSQTARHTSSSSSARLVTHSNPDFARTLARITPAANQMNPTRRTMEFNQFESKSRITRANHVTQGGGHTDPPNGLSSSSSPSLIHRSRYLSMIHRLESSIAHTEVCVSPAHSSSMPYQFHSRRLPKLFSQLESALKGFHSVTVGALDATSQLSATDRSILQRDLEWIRERQTHFTTINNKT